jgi:predicted porin
MAAGALAASPAAAEDPISLSVGGYYQSVFSIVDQDVTGINFHEINVRQEGEVQFTGKTTLDNGLTIGVNIQLEAVAQGDQLDEQFVFFSGDWGRVNVGAENSASYLMAYAAPSVGLGVNSPNFYIFQPVGNALTANFTTAVSDANKLTYFSPRFSGFQLGVSYTPNIDARAGDRQTFGLNTDDDFGDQSNYFSVGGNFVESFNGVDIAISGVYERGEVESNSTNVATTSITTTACAVLPCTLASMVSTTTTTSLISAGADDDEAWAIGVNVGFSGFTVGGSYGEDNNGLSGNFESTGWDVGGSYSTGPWGVSVTYMHTETEIGAGGGEDDRDLIEGGVSYALGPGITIVGSVQYMEEDNDSGVDTDGFAGAIMSKLSF